MSRRQSDSDGAGFRRAARFFSGVGLFVLLIVVVSITIGTSTTDRSPLGEAINTRIYTQGTFYAVVVIGLALGIYIATRADD